MENPYVVSQDAAELLRRHGFNAPDHPLSDLLKEKLTATLHGVFPNVVYVSGDELRDSIIHMASLSGLPTIFQTEVYQDDSAPPQYTLNINRVVTPDGDDLVGQRARPRREPIEAQISVIPPGDYAIVDDVVCSGKGVCESINLLAKSSIHIRKVIAGIAIGEGMQRIGSLGIEVLHGRYFEEVIDEVCERDFLPFVPLGGRTVITVTGLDYCLPYVQPWGRLHKWASIPYEYATFFSRSCMHAALELWDSVAPDARIKDVQRVPYGIHDHEEAIVKYLQRHIR